jgi:hypothetical protein
MSMHTVSQIESYLSRYAGSDSAQYLAEYCVALERNEYYPLDKLFAMDYEAFELALALMSEWRTDRFFAGDIGLLDNVKQSMPAMSGDLQAA